MTAPRGKLFETTGPERTLAEGFRRLALTGGLEELVRSASAFPTLDLDLLGALASRWKRSCDLESGGRYYVASVFHPYTRQRIPAEIASV